MKLSAFKPIQRRDLLKALGGAAFVLPGLELFEREARAQTAGKQAKFAVFCYTPDGNGKGQECEIPFYVEETANQAHEALVEALLKELR